MSVDPKKSMASHSGHVKDKVNKLRKFMEEKQDGLTGLTRKRAETLMNEVTDMYSSMETKWLTFMDEVQSKWCHSNKITPASLASFCHPIIWRNSILGKENFAYEGTKVGRTCRIGKSIRYGLQAPEKQL